MIAAAVVFLALTVGLVVKFGWAVLVPWLVPWGAVALLAGVLWLVFERPRRNDPPGDRLDWF